MKRIGIVSGSNRLDGIQIGMKAYENALSKNYKTTWYQCIDPTFSDTLGVGIPILGTKIPFKMLEMGINRLFVFRKRFHNQGDELLILSDPTLLKVPRKLNNVVVKVHDLRPLTKYSDNFFARIMFKIVIRKLKLVRGIIVTTLWMKEQIGEYVPEDSLIFVVPDTCNMVMDTKHRIERSIERVKSGNVNITYIGTDRPYKNIRFYTFLAENMPEIEGIKFNFHLITKLKEPTKRLLKARTIPRLILHETVNDITEIYYDTDIYVQPSLYEGFGRPIIEAMACGIPVIANSIESFQEIIGDAGMLIPVEKPEEWFSGILNMLQLDTLKRYSDRSLLRYERFGKTAFEAALSHAIEEFLNRKY